MIFYFTGTGNSLYAAKRIASALNEGTPKSIAQELRGSARAYKDERIGIVCPVYGHDLPPFVKRFIQNSTFAADYLFLVLTYGNRHGGAAQVAADFCKNAGVPVAYAKTLLMVDNWLPSYDVAEELAANKPIEEQVEGIISELSCKTCAIQPSSEEDRRIYEEGVKKYGAIFENGAFLDSMLQVSEGCTGCGTCLRVCPGSCYELAVPTPDGAKRALRKPYSEAPCAACLACIHACPAKAIILPRGEANPGVHFLNEHVTLREIELANGLSEEG